MEKIDFPIDIVVLWVDGSDPVWQASFKKHAFEADKTKTDISFARYRDNGLLKYWFRGIEKCAPWVRTVHFVTCGQKPAWLNENCPKLHLVNHSDYIPEKYLPLFNSEAIELPMYRIPGLAEHFVYFNDDLFLVRPVDPSFYFSQNGKPKDLAFLGSVSLGQLAHTYVNNEMVIDSVLDKTKAVHEHRSLWLNPRYGKKNLSTLFYWKKVRNAFVRNSHFSQPYERWTFEDLWERAGDALEETLHHRFRSYFDCNHAVFKEYALYKGNFVPANNVKARMYLNFDDDINRIEHAILDHKYQEVVINDQMCDDYEERTKRIQAAFQKLLPEKSSFEK